MTLETSTHSIEKFFSFYTRVRSLLQKCYLDHGILLARTLPILRRTQCKDAIVQSMVHLECGGIIINNVMPELLPYWSFRVK